MLIGILGPLAIERDRGPVELGGNKRRLLLTLLAASSPRPVSIERITDALWGDDATQSAAATVQTYVYQLRKLLGPETVVTMPAAYALAGCDVDADHFEALLRHDARETVEARRSRLGEALRLWRGEPFAEFPDVAELVAEGIRLVELRLAATANRIDDDLALGHDAAVVAELESLVARHPLRERFWAQLMVALYRSDRQAEALRAYARLRHHLRDEVGVSPGQALATLEQQILSHDPALRASRQAPAAEHPPTARRRAAVLDIAGDGAAHRRRLRFDTVTDAVDAARQESDRDPAALIAVHVGEVDDHGGEPSGPAVDRVARLRAVAQRGQILLTAAARAEITTGRVGEVQVADLGEHRLRSFGQPERVFQLLATGPPSELLSLDERTAEEAEIFVGRTNEVDHVLGRIRRLRADASGGVVMLVGEAGIGKTATAHQIAGAAAAEGVLVLWGRSIDGPWAAPYGAVTDAIAGHLRGWDGDDALLVRPETRDEMLSVLPSAGTAAGDGLGAGDESVDAAEWRLRVLVTIGRFVTELSATSPVLLVLDDLQWADAGTLAAVRHLARETVRTPVLVLGTFRDDEVGGDHPLRAVLGALPRESNVERVRLRGLTAGDIAEIAREITGTDVAPEDADRIAADTAGNPFFIHQVIRQPGGLPGSVVDVVAHRLRRLPASTQQLLRAACVFDSDFPFTAATAVAGLDEGDALDALDGALNAYLLVAGDRPDTYGFVHALAREAIAAELNPSRRIRLHRRAAEALLASAGLGELTADLAAGIAGHFHRSRSLPGSEQGVPAALVAAEHATAVGAFDDAVEFCRAALDLAPPGHAGRPELLGGLGLALARAARADEATATMEGAVEAIAAAHGPDRAADYVVEAWRAGVAGLEGLQPRLLERGLELAGDRRDLSWAYLYVLWAEFQEDDFEQIVHGELFALASRLVMAQTGNAGITCILSSTHPTRDDLLTLHEWPSARLIGAGDLLTTVEQFHETAVELKRAGRLLSWAKQLAYKAMAETALGNLASAGQILDEVAGADLPFTASSEVRARLLLAAYVLWCAEDDGWDRVNRLHDEFAAGGDPADGAIFSCARAKAHARRGRVEAATVELDLAVPCLPLSPSAADFDDRLLVHDFVEALWLADLDLHLALAGRLVDERLARDLRGPMSDMRLCKARLAALGGDTDDAGRWFSESRLVLDEAGARPLRAIADFDEALMHFRLGAHGGDGLRAGLLDAALRQFTELGMTGWLRRADTLAATSQP